MDTKFVANRIRKMCDAANINVKEMLDKAGVNSNAIVNMSNGSCPKVEIIEKIANFFHISINTLLYEQPNDDFIFELLGKHPNLLTYSDNTMHNVSENLNKYLIEKTSGDERLNKYFILDKLQKVRQERNYDLIEFLEMNGLNEDCFHRLKSLEYLTNYEVDTLSKVLSIDKSEFFYRYQVVGYSETKSIENIFHLSQDEINLLDNYRLLDEYGKNTVIAIVNAEKYRIDNTKISVAARNDNSPILKPNTEHLDDIPTTNEE